MPDLSRDDQMTVATALAMLVRHIDRCSSRAELPEHLAAERDRATRLGEQVTAAHTVTITPL